MFAYVGLERGNLEFTAALDRIAAPGVVNDQSAHYARRIPHKPRPVGKLVSFTSGNIEIGLVQQRCDAQASRGSESSQFALRQPMQLRVQSAEKRVGGFAIALFSRPDKGGNCR